MNAPLIWIILPMLVSIALLVIRKHYALATLIQLAFCGLLVFLLLVTRIEEAGTFPVFAIYIQPAFVFLGRSFILTENEKFIIGLFYTILAIWTLILFLRNQKSKIIPLGLALTSLLLAAMAVEPFLYSALIIEMALITGILIAFDVESGRHKGIIRALIYFTLGMPFILLAGWYLAGGETSPVNNEQLVQASLLLGMGFVFWLGVFPFHSWIPLIAEESEIADGIYVLSVVPFSITMILLKYLNGFVWLRDYQTVYNALILLGTVMILSGAIWSVFQTNLKKMVGYLTIYFSGYILVALGLNSSQGYLVFSELLLPRFLSLTLIMTAMLIINDQYRLGDFSNLKSLFYRYPFSSAGLLISLFTLVGMPLTVGFLPMQSLYQAIARGHLANLVIMILSTAILTLSFLRIFMVIMQPVEDEFEEITQRENLVEKILITAMIGINLISGLLPKIFFPGFTQILSSFELLVK